MNFGAYGVLIIFGAFVLLMILNPNLSCFGKRLKSPLYPLLRKRSRPRRRQPPTEDYGFDLGGDKADAEFPPRPRSSPEGKPPTEDYGFDLGGSAARRVPDNPAEKDDRGNAG
jgi:hypothetical protein